MQEGRSTLVPGFVGQSGMENQLHLVTCNKYSKVVENFRTHSGTFAASIVKPALKPNYYVAPFHPKLLNRCNLYVAVSP
jgi:hypothetical protein